MYQATVDRADRPRYDFSLMEDFANAEKARLGIRSPAGGFNFRPVPSSSTHALDSSQREGGQPPAQDFTLPFTLPRVRQRKLSQSAPGPRRGKMALFEQPSAPPPALASRAPHLATGTTLSAVPSYENLSDVTGGPGGLGNGDLDIGIGGGAGSGHDRPYRFSFYSNALSATIHARSLCELPAEGQSFEDLFLGQGNMTPKTTNGIGAGPNNLGRMGVGGMGGGANGPVPRSAASSPIPIPAGVNGDRAGGISKMYPNERRNGNGVESYTWWLDVLSPTDEEMKLLSKVFSIHPLTTEDIQMEETREKIELFRNLSRVFPWIRSRSV
ncbi:hypothetical protein A0H81_09726 [Grifola frondosa]|uniref:Uncharacterized protein n=1 Tax=Grifola frondosa TaxID=5627 RepID=A0A1C7LZL1_GRIFR|nr:hypothetical protein A0H81_09726 [Grifola frondosa]